MEYDLLFIAYTTRAFVVRVHLVLSTSVRFVAKLTSPDESGTYGVVDVSRGIVENPIEMQLMLARKIIITLCNTLWPDDDNGPRENAFSRRLCIGIGTTRV